jgi:preprotein translocase subunit SecE
MPDGDIKDELERELSPGRQTTQHAVGLVLVFIVSFTLAFYMVNRSL